MSDEKDDKDSLCLSCMASKIASHVLSDFSDAHPEVVMSYDNWIELGFTIEMEIRSAFGDPTLDEPEEGKTVQ